MIRLTSTLLAMAALIGCGPPSDERHRSTLPDLSQQVPATQPAPDGQPPQQEALGPFGLSRGMSRAAIEAAIDSTLQPRNDQAHLYTTATVPRPLERVDFYVLLVLPNAGLCQIRVIGITVNSSSHGVELRNEYLRVRDALQEVYGTFGEADYLRTGSIWDEPEDWMMAVRRRERILQAAWDAEEGSTMRNNVKQILLGVSALNTSSGWITLQYQFDNEEECDAEMSRATTSVL